MSGKTVGLTLNHGFAGSYARQPDMIVNTRTNVGQTPIKFGDVLITGTGGVQSADATATAASFVGIAVREIKTQTNYLQQADAGSYEVGEPVSVFQRGRVNVICKSGTPALYGAVYLRLVATAGKAVGDLEAAPDATTGNSVLLTNCQWGGGADVNGVTELVILNAVNA